MYVYDYWNSRRQAEWVIQEWVDGKGMRPVVGQDRRPQDLQRMDESYSLNRT